MKSLRGAGRMNPPTIQGGQGRSAQSIGDTGWFLVILIVLFLGLFVGAMLA